ncbi:DUF2255 family protein [Streptomyces sp. NPDC004610]|uniref:DUF2255 family protein n=1 Tax=unclassified Streptomyces TaxID=2593676 RepID=UPI00339F142A
MSPWSDDRLARIADAWELRLTVVQDGDNPTGSVPLGFVVVEGGLYVRAYRSGRSTWFRQARSIREGRIEIEGRRAPVTIEAPDPELAERISAAYEAKYPDASGVVTPAAVAATLRLVAR